MHTIDIEWRHLEEDGDTCLRCGETGTALHKTVANLQLECGEQGWDIRFTETPLDAGRISESNMILLNGIPIEQVLPHARSGTSDCKSCCTLIGEATECRTVVLGAITHEAIPEQLIREAVCRIADCC
jgi:hypothetical protein